MILQDKLEDYTIVQKARDLETGLVSEWWERRTPERLIPDSGTECLLRDPHWELSDLLKITQEVHRQINGLSVTSSHQQAEPWLSGDCGLPGTNPEPVSAEIPRWLPLHSICCSQVLCSVPAINKDTRGKRESRPKGSGDNTQESGLNTREKHRSHKMGLTNTAVSEGKNEGWSKLYRKVVKSLMVRKRRTNKQTNKNKLRSVLQGIGPQCREENKEGGRSGAEEGVSGSSLALGLKHLSCFSRG